MESIFNLEETSRSSLLQHIIRSFGFTYVCLWSHHSNCMIFVDGVYKEENSEAAGSSSAGSLAMRSFLDYQKSVFFTDSYDVRVPGFAFKHNLTYMEHKGLDLLQLASSQAQLQFYQEARIKTAIFMGCKNGEIELGMANPNGSSQDNYEFKLKELLPGDFPHEVLSQPLDQARASSSSSSLRSLSMETNVDYPPFLFNMLQTPSSSTMRSEDPVQQALIQFRSDHLLPSREHEEAAMTRAILAAMSSSSSNRFQAASAFKRYQTNLGPLKRVQNPRNLNRRSLAFFRNLSEARVQHDDQMIHTTRLTSNQVQHMISERRRREKLNDSFQALRSLLPPGSKKNKASVLSNIKEYIDSLKSQAEELIKRNKFLEAEYSKKETFNQESGGFTGERPFIRITDSDESNSESRGVELEVNVSGNSILKDLVVRVLKFMNQVENITVTSIDAHTRTLETEAITNQVVLRLRIEGSEWDITSFQEALTRAIDDLAQ